MKANTILQARMQELYQQYLSSNLSKNEFCQRKNLSKGKFSYLCRQFEQEITPEVIPSVEPTSTYGISDY